MRVWAGTYSGAQGWSSPPDATLDSSRTLALVFGAEPGDALDGAVASLRSALPGAVIAGCSTAGGILGATILDDRLSVAVLRFDAVDVRMAWAEASCPADSCEAATRLAGELAGPGLRAVLVLSDGLSVNGSELIRGFNEHLPAGVVVSGGLAADGDRFERTWVLADDRPQAGVVTAIGLYGEGLVVGHGSRGGWDIFGPERRVTKSTDNVLYELDGRKALSLYREYLGELATGLPASALLFPLALRTPGTGEVVVRTILGIDEEAESLTFAGDMPAGATAQLMRANFDRLVHAASGAAEDAARPAEDDVVCLAVSCVGRRLILRERAEEELEASLEALAPGTLQVGFYSYGEISPAASGSCDLHNQTMTVTTISERPLAPAA